MSIDNFKSAIVRINNDEEGKPPRGTGFLVSKSGDVITCAHVLDNKKVVGDRVSCSMLEGHEWQKFTAIIRMCDKEADIVHLKLDQPTNATPFYFANSKDNIKKRFEAIGFNQSAVTGVNGEGQIKYYKKGVLDNGRWEAARVQLDEANSITSGFSGGPLVVEGKYVAGMLVHIMDGKYGKQVDLAFAIPTEVIIEKIQGLPKPIEAKITSSVISHKIAALCDRHEQQKKISKSIDFNIQKGSVHKQPVFYLALGKLEDSLDTMVESFKFKVKERTQRATPEKLIKSWPKNLPFDQAKSELKENMNIAFFKKYSSDLKGKDLLTHVEDPNSEVLLIIHFISIKEWNADQEKLFNWYLKEFWRIGGENKVSVHIFFKIILPEPAKKSWYSSLIGKKHLNEEIHSFLQLLVKDLEANQMPNYLLTPVRKVSREDVQVWTEEFGLNREPIDFLDKVFGGKNELPMEKVYTKLKLILKKATKQHIKTI